MYVEALKKAKSPKRQSSDHNESSESDINHASAQQGQSLGFTYVLNYSNKETRNSKW